MKLLLFDIDGTILTLNGAGRRAVERALSALCGKPIDTSGIPFSGKTDPQILRLVLEANQCGDPDLLLNEAMASYTKAMLEIMPGAQLTLMPGIVSLVERLADDRQAVLGLLTGNIESLAYAKLALAGLDKYFRFGAFGSDHADRNELPAIALERAHGVTGRSFSPEDVYVIGDTEHDVRCAHTIGARAVAVCTGNYARTDLQVLNPHALLDDLSDHSLFYQHVFDRAA